MTRKDCDRRWYQQRRDRAEKLGLCRRCVKHSPEPGRKFCLACLLYQAEKRRRLYRQSKNYQVQYHLGRPRTRKGV